MTNGHAYRMRDTSFAIDGPTTTTLDSDAQPDTEFLTAVLGVGAYTIPLAGGWFLERREAGVR